MTDRSWRELGAWAFWFLMLGPVIIITVAMPIALAILVAVRAHRLAARLILGMQDFSRWFNSHLPR